MKVFISWSGERSKKVAELLAEWIPSVIQAVDSWISTKDIEKGSIWFNDVSGELANTSVGIICITKENKDKPWILFEAGSLAKGLNYNKVCTFLIDLNATDVHPPLAHFNHTLPTREDVEMLMRTINSTLNEKSLKELVFSNAFETFWPKFEGKFQNILASTPSTEVVEVRDKDDIMLEVLTTVRSLDKRIRIIESTEKTMSAIAPFFKWRQDTDPGTPSLRLLLRHFILKGLTEDQILEQAVPIYGRDTVLKELKDLRSQSNDTKDETSF